MKQTKANRILSRECTGHRKYPFKAPFKAQAHTMSTCGHHQKFNTKIRLIIFFATEDEEALYSQQKQDPELTVSQVMSTLLQNSGLN